MFLIDLLRLYEVGVVFVWYVWVMVFGWGIIVLFVVLMVCYFKVLLGQDWLCEFDFKVWWWFYWIG